MGFSTLKTLDLINTFIVFVKK